MDYNCTKQIAYSIKKTTKKAFLSKSMSTYNAGRQTTNFAKQVAEHRKDYNPPTQEEGLQMCQAGSL